MTENFIAFDIESENKTPNGIVILAAHSYKNSIISNSIILKRDLKKSEDKQSTWFNEHIRPNISEYDTNCNSQEEIRVKFLEFYLENNTIPLITYCSNPYEQFIINYLEHNLDITIPHLDIYQSFSNIFNDFRDLESFLQIPLNSKQRHNPSYDAKVVGDVYLKLLKQERTS
jgi:hypothetical protein